MILQNILLKHRNNDDNIIYYQSLGGSERTSRLVLCYKCKKMVVTLQHEGGDGQKNDALSRLLYEADKQSRMCMFCKASESCNWGKEEKNAVVTY